MGSLRAERRRPLASRRAQPLHAGQPRPRRGGQLAAAPERPRPAAAAVLVDRARLQALRPARVGGQAAARALGAARRPRDVRVRRAPLRPAHRGLRGGRPHDDAALLRPGAHDARRHLHDGGARDGVRRPRGRGVRPAAGRRRRALGRADRLRAARAVAPDGGGRPLRRVREPRRPARPGRAAPRRRPRVGARPRRVAGQGARTGVGDAVGLACHRRAAPRSSRWPSRGGRPPRARTSTCGSARSAIRRRSTRRSTTTSRRSGTRWRPGARSCRSPSAASS